MSLKNRFSTLCRFITWVRRMFEKPPFKGMKRAASGAWFMPIRNAGRLARIFSSGGKININKQESIAENTKQLETHVISFIDPEKAYIAFKSMLETRQKTPEAKEQLCNTERTD